MFGESAKMPITVSNDLPYAVSVQVNSLTDSMQIVTSRTADIDIPSHSDAQVTFTIRVSTSGSSTAHVSLTDREGNSFGNTQDTAITSVMRVSDASGFIIIGLRRATGHYRPVAAVPSEEGPRRMSSSVGRNSLIMATGTAASRVTGQLRTILLAAAIGTTGLAANAYQAGSMIPQSVFTLVSGGIFNAVLVPQIVRTLKEKDAQERLNRLITLAIGILLAMTVVMAAASPLLARLYVGSDNHQMIALTTSFTLWCMPQVFFYGLYTVLGQILAAKDHFLTYAWSSTGANIISCAGLLAYSAVQQGQ